MISMKNVKITENKIFKVCKSPDYNFIFNKVNGTFLRWGKNKEDDPKYSPYGPEIVDMEISVNGCPNKCSFCYKSNNSSKPTNMTFDTFVKIFKKLPNTVTQIAFGITGVQTNPDFIKILKYCRKKEVIPNFTLSGFDLTDEMAKECSKTVGAVAVSAYSTNKDICYNTVEKFINLGVAQTNIHLLVAEESIDFVYEGLQESQNDKRLEHLNAIVLLSVKNKGRAKTNFSSLSIETFLK